MHIDISGKVVIITGAGRGIGAGIARRFADEGTRLVLIEKDPVTLAQIAKDVHGRNAEVEAIECDVRDEQQVVAAVDRAAQRFGTIDILINNASIAPGGTIEKLSLADWEDNFATNVRGVFLCSRAVVPHMKRQRWGRILNASSFAAIIPSYASAPYAASKAAVASMTRVLASELGPWNVTVNSYAPGMIPTLLNHFAEAPPERQRQLLNSLAIRRWGTPDEIASLLIFLASEHACYITGSLIDTSGGKLTVQFPQTAYEESGQL